MFAFVWLKKIPEKYHNGLMKNFLSGFFSAVFLLMVGVVYYHYEIQDTLIFKSLPLHKKHIFTFRHNHEELYLPTSENGQIHALHFTQPNAKGVVYFLHGNSKNLDFHAHRAEMFVEGGFDFFSIDYRGFGKSSRGFKEEWILEDAMVGYDYLKDYYPEDKIVVIGHSLGSAMATHVAANNNPKALVLEAPFYSMIAAASFTKPYLPQWLISIICKYPLRTDNWIKDVKAPVYIFHGTVDNVVPYYQGKMLFEKGQQLRSIQFYTLDGWGHEDLQHHDNYQAQIWDILGIEKPKVVIGAAESKNHYRGRKSA